MLEQQCFLADAFNRFNRLDRLVIPRTLTRVVKTFLDRLNPHEQMVVKIASVLQQPFELHVLAQAFKDDGLIDQQRTDNEFLRERQGQSLERLVSEGVFMKDLSPTEEGMEGAMPEIEGMVRWRYQFCSPVMGLNFGMGAPVSGSKASST